jgi:hypothetical protein
MRSRSQPAIALEFVNEMTAFLCHLWSRGAGARGGIHREESMAKNKAKNKDRNGDSPTRLRAETGPRAAGATPSRAESGPAPATTAGRTVIQGQIPLFYERPRPLHLTEHADLALKSPLNFAFAATTVAVPVLLGEFLVASRDYPIVFGPGETPVPVAFMGVSKGENLFVGRDGTWLAGTYIPAYVRRCPFLLVAAGETKRRILFVDEASPNVTRGKGIPLIADGKPTEAAQNAIKFCDAYAFDQEKTREFCEALVAQDLLETRNIALTLPGGGKIVLKDMRMISPRKFEEMSDSKYLEWRKRKWLFPAFCHFQSGLSWQHLAERAGAQRAKS